MLVMHGGAGTIARSHMTPETEQQYRDTLAAALRSGHAVLTSGRSGLDAVEAAIRILEDSPLFNAGRGSVYGADGIVQMDAAIMDGRTMMAGAVANVTNIRNPISAARAVMEKSPHVMLAGRGAELFAESAGIETADAAYFHTDRRWREHLGTVGAVALDVSGNLAAGTSTGGTTNKLQGRIGDSPIIGAGTYAANDSVAVSCTGQGEFFIRWAVAYDIAALYKYKRMTVQQAGDDVIHNKLAPVHGEGGAIVLDANGDFAMPFNTEGMYRGWIGADGVPHVFIYKE